MEVYSIRSFNKKFNERAQWYEERGSLGDQLGTWLLSSEGEDKPSNLDVLTSAAGAAFYRSSTASLAGLKSGEVRHFQKVEDDVFNSLLDSDPDVKFIAGLLEKAGLGEYVNPKDLPYIIQKFGGRLLGNDGNPRYRGKAQDSRFKY